MDSIILEEAHILSRNYSTLRTKSKKWVFLQTTPHNHEKIKFVKDNSETIVLVTKRNLCIGYQANMLYKRSQIRRNYGVFLSIQRLWELVNPFKLAGISEKVYLNLYLAICKLVLKDSFDQPAIEKLILSDKKQDFGEKSWLGFADFYDSFFEFIDSNTHTESPMEYSRLIKALISGLLDIKWSLSMNLYSKLHIINETRAFYHPWMISYIKSQEIPIKNSDEVPSLIKLPDEVPVSSRLLSRRQPKPVDRENFNLKKLEKMMNAQFLKEFKHGSRCVTQSHARLKIPEKRNTTFYANYLDKISPLSSMKKQSRGSSDILEKVIDGRKGLNFKSFTKKELFL